MKTENDAAIINWKDCDDSPVGDVNITVKPGWKLLGDAGWMNDFGWNDVPWSSISEELAFLDDETAVDSKEIPNLPDGYTSITIRHEDDDYNNVGTANSNAWEITYIFKNTIKPLIQDGATAEEAEQALRLWELLLPGLRVKRNGRVDTDWGDKTPLGLYRTIKRVID